MRYTQSTKATICMFLLLGIAALANAQDSAPSQGQEELDQALEMMRQSGMSPEDIAQTKGILGGLAEAEAQRKQEKLAQEQQAFGMANPGSGTATVRAGNSVYELRITKCEVTDSRNGIFRIDARQSPGMADAVLQLHSDGRAQSANFAVESPRRDNYNAENPRFAFDGTTATWSGNANGRTGRAPLSIEASCGDEAVYLDKPSRPAPNLGANSLMFYLDDDAHRFDIGYCSDQEVVSGNAKTVFAITATGTFRGRPAIVFLNKIEVALGGQEFLDLKLQLGELTKEQRQLSPFDAQRVNGGPAVMNPDRFPSATSSRGMITRDGRNVHFRGVPLTTGDSDPEFADLSGYPEVFASCEESAAAGPQQLVIALASQTVRLGQPVSINVKGLPGNRQDWLALVPANAPDSTFGQQWAYTQGARGGNWTFIAPRTGEYEVRVYFNWPAGEYKVQARTPVSVVAN